MFDFAVVTEWVDGLLRSWLPESWALLAEFFLIGLCLLLAYAVIALVLIYAERKICAFFQCRLGPNRVGPKGTVQSVADMFKMLIKELIQVRHVDNFLFNLAPYIVIISSVLAFGCIPYAKGLEIIDFNVGIFFLLAVSSIGIVGILLAGWSSNNKYSLIGAMRSGAQMISYELSIGLSILTMVVFSGSMQLSTIVESQADGWFLFRGHIPAFIAFVVYLIAGTAETNRGPFDLPEADSELTAGYHTEYSGMHFGFFYLAEYLNMFIVASVATTLFLGGWMPLHIPGWEGFNAAMDWIPSIFWFVGKVAVIIFIIMWFKWTFPRLRIDQLLRLEWKYLLPLNLCNLLLMVVVVVFNLHF
ncbi:NADH-quinone oxidoreductase subunit NuoH [Gallalistipes aquisgranensis]|uniref:NADH-quinone oxidoreductase subunit NuoH n=1 Tax=Gallalistipes aquisgranensis TaxID=2779358 RepID=UPI001CF7F08B|nr:NADH-quinone oxidoreductase subunit NuoH [Gallalistipes aquisgranensis]MBE5032911.1 NADH-quinone oxidoreductase subunit NuoH [Gallalistipes aquisgranensis]